uniref:Uncharacterized protein n=1 Tax=Rhizophora mucronata TaxID=61149 RepID=A0A2P2P8I1_RHIMU
MMCFLEPKLLGSGFS